MNPTRKLYLRTLSLLILAFACSYETAQSRSSMYLNAWLANDKPEIQFSWETRAQYDGFRIYWSENGREDPNNYQVLVDLKFEQSFRRDTTGYDSSGKETYYSIHRYLHDLKGASGVFHFFIRAYSNGEVGEPSNIVMINTVEDVQTAVKFITEPIETAVAGDDYVYDADAEAENGMAIRYYIKHGPEGMTIDETTGELRWQPQTPGSYFIRIHAEVNRRSMAVQIWTLRVRACREPAVISGTIRDEDGELIREATSIWLIPTNQRDTSDTSQYSGSIVTQDGQYRMEVDAGRYLLVASARGYRLEYYDDAEERQDAVIIELGCGDKVEADFVLDKVPHYDNYRVSGQVTLEPDGEPAAAMVSFFGFDPSQDKQDRFNSKHIRSVLTNYDGYYSARLSNQFTYIVYVSPMPKQGVRDTIPHDTLPDSWSSKFVPEYYLDAYELAEAQTLELTGDVNDLDILVGPAPDYDNGIEGIVTGAQGQQISAWVTALRILDAGSDALFPGASVRSDDEGKFSFNNLLPGQYVILAGETNCQSGCDHIHGYYVADNEFAVPDWTSATRLDVEASGSPAAITVKLQKIRRTQGTSRCRGKVGRTVPFSHKDDDDRVQADDAIPGALVYLVDDQDQIVAFNLTATDGSYDLDGISAGVYHLRSDKFGMAPQKIQINIGEEGETVTADLELEPMTVSNVAERGTAAADVKVFPNPTRDEVSLSLASFIGSVRISMTNAAGQIVRRAVVQAGAGDTVHSFAVAGLSAGFYLLRIESQDHSVIRSVMIQP